MDDTHSPLQLFIFLLIIAVNFIMHMFGAALQDMNRTELESQEPTLSQPSRVKRLIRYIDNSSRFVYCTHIITTLSGIVIGKFFLKRYTCYMEVLFPKFISSHIVSLLSNAILSVFFCMLLIVIGISVPKKLAGKDAVKSALFYLPLTDFLMIICTPLILIIDGCSFLILKCFGIDLKKEEDKVSEEDIMSMVNEGHEQGVLESSEAQMITNIFTLNDKQARDVMTHRKSIVFIEGGETLDRVVDFLLTEGNNSRYPVYTEDIDHIIGILNMKDALICHSNPEFSQKAIQEIPHLIRQAVFIPETRSLDTLFREMQSEKNHMVVVVDEYGQTAGIVSMEDILEEIVGNIMDEYDVEEELISTLSDGSYVVKGMTPLDDIEEVLGIAFTQEEHDQFDTINGLLIACLDRIPEDGETFSLNLHHCTFQALHVENRFIHTIKITKDDSEEETYEPNTTPKE